MILSVKERIKMESKEKTLRRPGKTRLLGVYKSPRRMQSISEVLIINNSWIIKTTQVII